MTTPSNRSGRVALVTADPESALARRARDSLAAARIDVQTVGPDALPAGPVHVLLDDPSLPQALARLIQSLSGREMLPDVVLVVADAGRGGLLLGDGFHDVVTAADAGLAVQNIAAAKAPVVHERVKTELEERFLPALVAEARLRSGEAERLLRECIGLVRARNVLAGKRAKLERLAQKQAVGDGLVAIGIVELFAGDLAAQKRPRPQRLKRFPALRLEDTALSRGEPKLKKRQRTLVADLIAWLDNADLIVGLGSEPRARLDAIAKEMTRTPIAALNACIATLENESRTRLGVVTKLQQEVEPSEAIVRWLSEQHGFEVMADSYAMPEHQARLIKSHIHPPPEIYKTWCLDLSAMRLVMTSEVLGAIARTLAPSSTAERRADATHQDGR